MLVLSRRIGEAIVIDGQIRVVVAAVEGGRVRLGITAPPAVRVMRKELRQRPASPPSVESPEVENKDESPSTTEQIVP
jgi:carbon storage regulator